VADGLKMICGVSHTLGALVHWLRLKFEATCEIWFLSKLHVGVVEYRILEARSMHWPKHKIEAACKILICGVSHTLDALAEAQD
jgi:hypothetical protein